MSLSNLWNWTTGCCLHSNWTTAYVVALLRSKDERSTDIPFRVYNVRPWMRSASLEAGSRRPQYLQLWAKPLHGGIRSLPLCNRKDHVPRVSRTTATASKRLWYTAYGCRPSRWIVSIGQRWQMVKFGYNLPKETFLTYLVSYWYQWSWANTINLNLTSSAFNNLRLVFYFNIVHVASLYVHHSSRTPASHSILLYLKFAISSSP
jgi:hypothetical protein